MTFLDIVNICNNCEHIVNICLCCRSYPSLVLDMYLTNVSESVLKFTINNYVKLTFLCPL